MFTNVCAAQQERYRRTWSLLQKCWNSTLLRLAVISDWRKRWICWSENLISRGWACERWSVTSLFALIQSRRTAGSQGMRLNLGTVAIYLLQSCWLRSIAHLLPKDARHAWFFMQQIPVIRQMHPPSHSLYGKVTGSWYWEQHKPMISFLFFLCDWRPCPWLSHAWSPLLLRVMRDNLGPTLEK